MSGSDREGKGINVGLQHYTDKVQYSKQSCSVKKRMGTVQYSVLVHACMCVPKHCTILCSLVLHPEKKLSENKENNSLCLKSKGIIGLCSQLVGRKKYQ